MLRNHTTTLAGLTPYTGEWTKETAAHLLRRTTFGPSYTEIRTATDVDGLNSTLNKILAPPTVPPPPLIYRADTEPDVSVGETWVTAPHPRSGGGFRYQSLTGWYYLNVMLSPVGIRDKMTLFWLNYFGMSGVRDPRAMYKTITLLHENCIGNFRTIIEMITVDPSMLEFLNGEINYKRNPNENFARELLELFTIQKGPQVASGDYTNYTEQDVMEIARALTGWTNLPFLFSDDDTPIESYFDPENHDTGVKQLSHRFGNAQINDGGAAEYKVVIDVILQQDETARAFCRELYRFFVFYDITPDIEQSVITPMASLLRGSNFEIAPVLRALLESDHFYDMQVRGAMIKNPLDFVTNMFRPFGEFGHLTFPTIQIRYESSIRHDRWCDELNMNYDNLPTVAGWQAYYQAPNYYRSWISTSTIQRRYDLVLTFMTPLYHVNNFRLPVNWRDFLASLSNPFSADDVINDVVTTFLPRAISPEQFTSLREHLLPGQLEASNWSGFYAEYLSNPIENSLTFTFERRLYNLFIGIFGMPEAQLH